MFISKKRFKELQEAVKQYEAAAKRHEASAREHITLNNELKEEIKKLKADMKNKNILSYIGADVEKVAEKIGNIFEKENQLRKYDKVYGGYCISFSGNIMVDNDELGKAAIAAVIAAIESLEPEHRRYVVLEYMFENIIEQAIKFAEINL